MQTYTIEQAYSCLYWQTVVVKAESLEQAIELAREADPDSGQDEDASEDEPGVLMCTEWSSNGGGAECGPTFTFNVKVGDNPDNEEYHYAPGVVVTVPEDARQFATEWPEEHAALSKARELARKFMEAAKTECADHIDAGGVLADIIDALLPKE